MARLRTTRLHSHTNRQNCTRTHTEGRADDQRDDKISSFTVKVGAMALQDDENALAHAQQDVRMTLETRMTDIDCKKDL